MKSETGSPNWLKSAGALLLGFIVIVGLSLGTDQVLHSLGVYPPWGVPMTGTPLLLLALAYRSAYCVLGCYLAARFAPRHPMQHALTLGGVGFILSGLGAIGAATSDVDLGPLWYPVALTLTTPFFAWLGGYLFKKQANLY